MDSIHIQRASVFIAIVAIYMDLDVILNTILTLWRENQNHNGLHAGYLDRFFYRIAYSDSNSAFNCIIIKEQ